MPGVADRRSRAARHPRERGSALLLFPAAVAVVLVLSAIAVDLSIALLGQRELAAAAAAAANDAVAAGLDEAAFRSTGEYRLDPARVDAAVRSSIDGQRPGLPDRLEVGVVVRGDRVTVRLVGSVPYLFAPAVPGGPRRAEVAATAEARIALR
ncbi:MAG: hypothetical protein IPM45_16275 [Acidimicrobiales bacterium]|nr:hypothetical protein [Acidimicrobiales bacterium]